MALYQSLKELVDETIFENTSQLITATAHNALEKEIIDVVGAAQVYVNPAVTFNPGTPENPVAYICLPGTYTNFGGLTITAPLGVLKWNGETWSATDLPFPSAYEQFRCKLNEAVSNPLQYTIIEVTQDNGGLTASAGQWVQFINPRNGRYECFQLEYDVTPLSSSIAIVESIPNFDFPVGSIVELDPIVNMKWHAKVLWGDGVNNYVDLPAEWFPPPATCINPDVWESIFQVQINQVPAYRAESPSAPLQFDLNASNRLRLEFADVLSVQDRIVVRALMPRHL